MEAWLGAVPALTPAKADRRQREIVEVVLRDVVDEDADEGQPAEEIETQVARRGG